MLKYQSKEEKFKVKVGSKEINFRKWTTRDQRSYLELLEKQKAVDITDKMIFNTLIKPCIDEKNIVLSTYEQKLLLIEMRKEGIGKTFKDTIKCPQCELETKVELNLDEIIKEFKESNWGVLEKDDIKITFGEVKNNKDKDILVPSKGLIKYVFNDFFLHMQTIEYNGEVHEVKNIKIVDEFFNDMPSITSNYFFEEYEKMTDKLVLEYDVDCVCGHQHTVNYDRIPGLLWI